MKKSTASSAASLTAVWWATTTSITLRPTSSCSAKWARSPRLATRRSSAAAAPSLFQMESWQELSNPRDLAKIFSTPEYAGWRSLRDSEDSKYIGIAMPRFLARRPYGAKSDPVEEFDFEEEASGQRHQQVHLGQLGLCDGGQHQPLVQALRLVLEDSRYRVGRRGRRAPDAHLPHRRRRRRHDLPDRNRHQRSPRGRASQGGLHAAHPQEELRLRRLHRRAVASQAGRFTTTPTRPPTRPSRRVCRTCSPLAASRTI